VEGVIQRQGVANELEKITTPTLVAVGDEDVATIPVKSDRIHHAVKGSKLIIIPKAGHSSCIEQAEEVNKIIQRFIS
jgi:pimeloyl-ACP methyl ester carboxylesterase